MRDWTKPYCKLCERHTVECGSLSTRGKCKDCREAMEHLWTGSLHYHDGPVFLEWRRRVAASVGAVLLDDLETLAQ